jgi:hypothetical protein
MGEQMKLIRFLMIIFVFGLGLAVGLYAARASTWQEGMRGDSLQLVAAANLFDTVEARENPMDRVPEKAIEVYRDRVILDVQDVEWATFTDTHSMEPVIFKGANALEIRPKSEDDIKVGDIVSYKSEYAEGNIIHRVVYKGNDEQGTYFVMKGDNLPSNDPGRIRFSQMQRVVIAVVY